MKCVQNESSRLVLFDTNILDTEHHQMELEEFLARVVETKDVPRRTLALLSLVLDTACRMQRVAEIDKILRTILLVMQTKDTTRLEPDILTETLWRSSKTLEEPQSLLSLQAAAYTIPAASTPETRKRLVELLKPKGRSETAALFLINISYKLCHHAPIFCSAIAGYLLGVVEVPDTQRPSSQNKNIVHSAARVLSLLHEEKAVPLLQEEIKRVLDERNKHKPEDKAKRRPSNNTEQRKRICSPKTSPQETFARLLGQPPDRLLGRVVSRFVFHNTENKDALIAQLIGFAGKSPKDRGVLLAAVLNTERTETLFTHVIKAIPDSQTLCSVCCSCIDIDEQVVAENIRQRLEEDPKAVEALGMLIKTFLKKTQLQNLFLELAFGPDEQRRARCAAAVQTLQHNKEMGSRIEQKCIEQIAQNKIVESAEIFLALFPSTPALIKHTAASYAAADSETKKKIHIHILRHIKAPLDASDLLIDSIESTLSPETLPFLRVFLLSITKSTPRHYSLVRHIFDTDWDGSQENPQILLTAVSEIQEEELPTLLPRLFSYLNGTAERAAPVKDVLQEIVQKEEIDEQALAQTLYKEKTYKTEAQSIEAAKVWTRVLSKEILLAFFKQAQARKTLSIVLLEALLCFLQVHSDAKVAGAEIFGLLVRKFVFGTDLLWNTMLKLARLLLPESIPTLLSLRHSDLCKLAQSDKELKHKLATHLLKQPLYLQKKFKMFIDDMLYQ